MGIPGLCLGPTTMNNPSNTLTYNYVLSPFFYSVGYVYTIGILCHNTMLCLYF